MIVTHIFSMYIYFLKISIFILAGSRIFRRRTVLPEKKTKTNIFLTANCPTAKNLRMILSIFIYLWPAKRIHFQMWMEFSYIFCPFYCVGCFFSFHVGFLFICHLPRSYSLVIWNKNKKTYYKISIIRLNGSHIISENGM